ncbi:MAG: hypothetical protein PHT84_00325 [Candidatus Pacebacteria bacterium]|nr:hypothetical protein [Candidatus Paceibacterota bacterium]
MEGFNKNRIEKNDNNEENESREIINADDFLELEKEDPAAYHALMIAIENKQEEERLNAMAEEADKLLEKQQKIEEYIKIAGFFKREDIDQVVVGDDGIARYQGMTIDEFLDFNKEDGFYR